MLAATRRQAGVTLVEMLVAVAVLAITLSVGVPSFSLWMQNRQVQTAAESIQNGLQLARTEAVRRNAPVRFSLTSDSGEVTWSVGCVNATSGCPDGIQVRPAAEGTPNARVGGSTDVLPSPVLPGQFNTALAAGAGMPAGVSFDSMGRVVAANVGTDLARIDVIYAANAQARRMVVTITPGGQIRLCNPAVALSSSLTGCS